MSDPVPLRRLSLPESGSAPRGWKPRVGVPGVEPGVESPMSDMTLGDLVPEFMMASISCRVRLEVPAED